MPDPARPTLRSLAAEAGVSPMTVSLALRGSREVSAATRRRIARLAAARGYRPDPQVAKLMHHLRTRRPARFQASICALADQWPAENLHADNYLARLLAGLRGRATALGYGFTQLNLDDYPRPDQLRRVLTSRGIEGVLLLPLREPRDLAKRLDWAAFSVVSVTSSVTAPRFHTVTPRHLDNMLLACDELARAGFRRIGLAMSREWDRRVERRWSAGIAWQNQFGGTEPVTPLIDDRTGPNLDPAVLAAWLARERPDAVVFETLDAAVLRRALARNPGLVAPKIVTMNWPMPGVDAGVDQGVEQIGAVAADWLAALVTRGEKGVPERPATVTIAGEWRRGTLGRAGRAGR